jgi:hypothetical protein
MKGKFCTVLIFDKEGNKFYSSFVDKHGDEQEIVLNQDDFRFIHPGIRYFCYINSKTFALEDAKVFIDDLFVIPDPSKNIVKLTLSGEEQPEFTFNPKMNCDVDFYTSKLKLKFIHKEYQLANARDIDTFISVYKESCEIAYSKHKKSLMKKFNKSFNNKSICVK